MNRRVSESQPGSTQEHRHPVDVTVDLSSPSTHLAAPSYSPPCSPNHPTDPAVEASLLGDAHLPTLQRQALVTQLGRLHGNHYLQRVIAQVNDRTAYGDPAEQEARAVEQAVGQDAVLPAITQHLRPSAIAGSWELNHEQQVWEIVFHAEGEEAQLVASLVNTPQGAEAPVLPASIVEARYGYPPGTFLPDTTTDEEGTNHFSFGHLPQDQQQEIRERLEYVETHGIEGLQDYLAALPQEPSVEQPANEAVEGGGAEQTAFQLQGRLNERGVRPEFPPIYHNLMRIAHNHRRLSHEEWQQVREGGDAASGMFSGDFGEAIGDAVGEFRDEAIERTLQRESVVRIGLPSTEPMGRALSQPFTLLFAVIDAAEGLDQVYDYSQWNASDEDDDYSYRVNQIYYWLLAQTAVQLVHRDPGTRAQWDVRAQRIYNHLRQQTLNYETWLSENAELLMQVEQQQRSERRWEAAP